MTYLFGDSTPAKLGLDYIDFLRRSLRVFADVLVIERRVVAAHERRRQIQSGAAQRRRRLELMRDRICQTAQELASESGDDAALRCAAAVVRSARDSAAAEIEAAAATAEREDNEALDEERRHRAACVDTLEKLLLRFDLPQSLSTVTLSTTEQGFVARLGQRTDYGASASFELAVPEDSPFSRELKVSAFAPDLEIHAPETGGWLRKEPRIVRHKAAKLHITEVFATPAAVRVELRQGTSEDAEGYRLEVSRTEGTVRLGHWRKDTADPEPFDVDPDDAGPLEAFAAEVARAADELGGCRARLADLRVDGASLTESGLPSDLIERAVAAMAPAVREIREHSLTPGELVLRRTIDHNRREESFVTVEELAGLLRGLPVTERVIFVPLELEPDMPPRAGHAQSGLEPSMEPSMEIEPSMIIDDGLVAELPERPGSARDGSLADEGTVTRQRMPEAAIADPATGEYEAGGVVTDAAWEEAAMMASDDDDPADDDAEPRAASAAEH